jgi:predicted ATPase/class 3 adenylate cyclase
MASELTLVYTDIVDSTATNARVGDAAMAAVWEAHDRGSRELLQQWRGHEVLRGDGLMAVFEELSDAASFAAAYHRLLTALPVRLQARAGLHQGTLDLRHNEAAAIALGARPLEVIGIAKAVVARLMALACGGQTLTSAATAQALKAGGFDCHSHGHWRLKGLDEPLEIFELGPSARADGRPPQDGEKAWRIVQVDGHWIAATGLPHTLPAERSSFIGRQSQLGALAATVRDGRRLLALLGAGGIGKTRLALRYAWGWRGEFPGGSWFCDLSAARSVDGVLHAAALGLDIPLGADAAGQIGLAIAGRGRCLVILDNFEPVARYAADTVGRWLDVAREAVFLVTSRARLAVPGETVMAVEPLEPAQALELLHERARAANPAYRAADADPDAMRHLLALLDHLPLAIELAAPRLRVLEVDEFIARMKDRFRLLSAGVGTADRHATLQATLQSSWELLTEAERSGLAQLSVFRGAFELPAAEAVLDLSALADAPWAIDLLQSLVDKSLLVALVERRFALLQSIREFAGSRTAADGLTAEDTVKQAARRHMAWYASRTEREIVERRGRDAEELVAACHNAMTLGNGATATACLVLSSIAIHLTGPFRAACELSLLVLASARLSTREQALAHWALGSTLFRLADYRGAHAALVRATELLPHPPQADDAARVHVSLGEVATAMGELDAAELQLRHAADAALHTGRPAMVCHTLNALGALAMTRGQTELARTRYFDAMTVARAAGDKRWHGGVLGNLAHVHYAEGRLESARQDYEAALVLTGEAGERRWQANSRNNLAQVCIDLGEVDRAIVELDTALKEARALGAPQLEYHVLCNLGLAFAKLGQPDKGRDYLQRAIDGMRSLGRTRDQALFEQYLAALAA